MSLKTDSSTSGFFSQAWPTRFSLPANNAVLNASSKIGSNISSSVKKAANLFSSACSNFVSGIRATVGFGKETVQGLRSNPVRAIVDLGRKAEPVWNKIPPWGKTAIGTAAVWAAPDWLAPGLAKLPLYGYLGWRHIPSPAKEAIRQFPPIASVHEKAKPLFAELNELRSSSSIVFAGKDINPLLDPPPDPKIPLKQIVKTTSKILENAAKLGVRSEEIADRPLVDPDDPQPRTVPVQSNSKVEPGNPVDSIPPLNLSLHSVPPATGPKEITDPVDLKAKTDNEIDKLCKKLSDFTTLKCMVVDIAGIEQPDYSSLLELVAKASNPDPEGQLPSLWSLFKSNFKPTLWQKFKAGLFYFWFHRVTALIPNTVETYLKRFIGQIRAELTGDHSNEISDQRIPELIENAIGLIQSYNDAADDFVAGSIPAFTTITQYRENRIAMHYGGSLQEALKHKGRNLDRALDETVEILREPMIIPNGAEKARPDYALLVKPYMVRARRILCKEFSAKIINAYSPHVEFFKAWKTHSFGKYFSFIYSPIERLLNRFLRNAMKKKILPSVLSSAIEEGIDATAKHNLPFSIALTNFVSSKLSELSEMIKNPQSAEPSSATLFPPPSVENLDVLVKGLLKTLAQAPLKTKEDFEDFKLRPKTLSPELQLEIENGIVDLSKSLFQYFAQPQNAESLFGQVFELANSAFSSNAARNDGDYLKLKKQLKKQTKDLKKEAKEVFKDLLHQAVDQKIKGSQQQKAKDKAELAFHDEKQEAVEAFTQLADINQKMKQRIENKKEINIHTEIASIAQILKSFANQEETFQEVEGLEDADRESIQRALAPLYQNANSVADDLASLQTLHKQYSNDSKLDAELSKVEDGLQSVKKFKFSRDEREKMRSAIREVRTYLPDFPQMAEELDKRLTGLSADFDRLVIEHKLLKELDLLCPLDGKPGLIEQLAAYQRGQHNLLPPGFKIKQCNGEIKRILSSFSKDLFPEAEAMLTYIDRLRTPDPKDFLKNWNALSSFFQKTRKSHENKKETLIQKLNTSRTEFHEFNEEKRAGYTLRKQKDRESMIEKMTQISEQLASLQADADKLEKHPQYHLTESRIGSAAAALTAAGAGMGMIAGAALNSFASWVGSAFGATAAFGISPLTTAAAGASASAAFLYRLAKKKNLNKVVDNDLKMQEPVVSGALAGAAALAIPAALSYPNIGLLNGAAAALQGVALAGSAVGAYRAGAAATGELVETVGQDKFLPEVTRYFDNAFELLTDSRSKHFIHGALTRVMTSVIASH